MKDIVMPAASSRTRNRKYYLRLIEFGLICLLLLLYFGYPIAYAVKAVRPAPSTLGTYSPKDFGQSYEDITFSAPDGVTLSGWYIPSHSRAAVILLHGYGSNRLQMFAHAEILSRHGFGVLLYDMRGSGLSGGDQRSFGWQDLEDVRAAVDFLQSRGDVDPGRIGIAGISTGAEVALGAAARISDIQAVLADGAGFPVRADIPGPATFEDYYMSPLTRIMFFALEQLSGVEPPQPIRSLIKDLSPRPLLLISSGSGMEKRQAEMYFALAGDPKEHWNLPESSHGMAVFTNPGEYEEKMVQFFQVLVDPPSQ